MNSAEFDGCNGAQTLKLLAKNISMNPRYLVRNLHFNLEVPCQVCSAAHETFGELRTCLELERSELSDQHE